MADNWKACKEGRGLHAVSCNMAEGHSAVALYRSGLIKNRKGDP